MNSMMPPMVPQNPMMAQQPNMQAEQLKQMMMIMGGLGQQQVPPQVPGQVMPPPPMMGMGANPLLPK